MTTPVTVSQVTNSRRQNIPAAAGHRRRARRSPGRSLGTTDFASRPGFPHDLGWGLLQNGRERVWRAVVPHRDGGRPGLSTLVNASYFATGELRVGRAAPQTAAAANTAVAVRPRAPACHSAPVGYSYLHTNRGRSRAETPAVAVARPPSASARPRADRRSDARVPGRASSRVTGRSCKTEIPG